jgi:hypothetical protein
VTTTRMPPTTTRDWRIQRPTRRRTPTPTSRTGIRPREPEEPRGNPVLAKPFHEGDHIGPVPLPVPDEVLPELVGGRL